MMRVHQILFASALLAATSASPARAQSASEHIALGDKEYAALHPDAALNHYVEALKLQINNYEALWKAARSAVDKATYDESGENQAKYFGIAETYSRAAVSANPGGAEGHFNLARVLGERALSVGVKQRVKFATEIHDEALQCLRIDPNHAGCLHVLGVWNAEIMRLSSFTRMIARNVLGGKAFGAASWADAKKYIDAAIASEPTRVVHYVDAAAIYRDLGNKPKARELYEQALKLPISDYNDHHYKAQAEAALKSL